MQLKIRLLLGTLVLLAAYSHAQDKIYKKDGKIIEAKVSAINQNTVIYHRPDNPGGPEYTILKSDVTKIVYYNGITDDLSLLVESEQAKNNEKETVSGGTSGRFGRNLISFIPASFIEDAGSKSINDPGIGVSYERLLDAHGHIGVVIPVILNFVQSKDFNSAYYYENLYSFNKYHGGYTSFLFMPGIKYYPANASHYARYSIGLSFFGLLGKEPEALYRNYGNGLVGTPPAGDRSYSVYGLAIANAIDISVSKHFFIEFNFNGLIRLSDNRCAYKTTFSEPFQDTSELPYIQFVLKAGYRF